MRINREITAPTVLLIHNGEQIKIPLSRALEAAEDLELDLVEVSPEAEPPVVKIFDYGKYMFKQGKTKAPPKVCVKEVQISMSICDADLERKIKQSKDFLAQGHKVKVELKLHGREIGRQQNAQEFYAKIRDKILAESVVESESRTDRRFFLLVRPKK
jgi:translation initiation factor IF-3